MTVATSTLTATDYTKRKEVFLDLYDEQLQFLSAEGHALSNVNYILHLSNGDLASGKTDEEGKTKRVATGNKSQEIVKAELTACNQMCCPQHAELGGDEPESVVLQVQGVSTTAKAVGTSVQVVSTPKGHSRPLTAGEIAMAKLVYADSVDYNSVRVHRGGYWLFFGFQTPDTAVTPNGEMYFPGKHFKEDYSTLSVSDQAWFMHEMVHVWQYQLGYSLKWVRLWNQTMNYMYTLDSTRKFCDYNMEEQGNLLADYFVVAFRSSPRSMRNTNYSATPDILLMLQATLSDFIANPKDEANLPKVTT